MPLPQEAGTVDTNALKPRFNVPRRDMALQASGSVPGVWQEGS